VEPFALDQVRSVRFGDREPHGAARVKELPAELASRGGTLGFLAEGAPSGWAFAESADAFLLSNDNGLS
jgi:hypothetical protein